MNDRDEDEAVDQARAIRALLLYGILPLWLVPGFVDYWFHRRARIEKTSGSHESILHAAQMTTIGTGVLAGLFLEIDAGVIALMLASSVVHEGLTVWDVAYADGLRDVVPNEQHCHSFLEVLPFTAFAFVGVMRARQTAALFGFGSEAPRWKLRPKRSGLSPRYVASILAGVTALIGIPYAEELARCYRVDRTFRSHREDPIQT